jgi:hypothetical protein
MKILESIIYSKINSNTWYTMQNHICIITHYNSKTIVYILQKTPKITNELKDNIIETLYENFKPHNI